MILPFAFLISLAVIGAFQIPFSTAAVHSVETQSQRPSPFPKDTVIQSDLKVEHAHQKPPQQQHQPQLVLANHVVSTPRMTLTTTTSESINFTEQNSSPSQSSLSSTLPEQHQQSERSYSNKVLLIRHGEKPPKSGLGLSKAGKKRAQCLRQVFGKGGKHNIGLIIAQSYNPRTGMRMRPYLTVKHLAKDLDLEVDVSCEREAAQCVQAKVEAFAKRSSKDVLICWKHSLLPELVRALGGQGKTPYPDDRFDIMWIMKHRRIIAKESEKCKDLDDHRRLGRKGHDRDLDLEDTDFTSLLEPDQEENNEEEFGAESDLEEVENYGTLLEQDIFSA